MDVVETTSSIEVYKETAGMLRVTQKSCIKKTSRYSNMQLKNSVCIPCIAYYKLSNMSLCTWIEVEHLSHASHISIVGCLSYAKDSIRFDLSHGIMRMYTINPDINCDVVRGILLILLRTIDGGACFKGCHSSCVAVTRFMNPGHAENLKEGKSK